MLKKALIGLAVVAASSAAALANGGSFAPAPASNCVGAFYVGAAVSRDVVGFDTNVNNYQSQYSPYYSYNPETDVTSIAGTYTSASYNDNHNFDWNADGVDGQLFAGYGMVFQDHYTLAAEVFGSISSAKGDFDTNGVGVGYDQTGASLGSNNYNTTASAELDHTIGIALLPGFKMSDSTTLYARVGYVYSEFKLDDNGTACTSGVSCVSTAALGYTPIDSDKNEGGLQLGLGAQTMVTSNVGVRLEYTWERYSDVNFATASSASSVDSVTGSSYVSNSYATNYKLNNPTVDTVNFGVFYAFNS